MEKTHQKIKILIPSSLAIESNDPKIKTRKIGNIARSASIFKVNEIVIYKDPEHDESKFIKKTLEYAETPPYLKRTLFGLSNDLKYVGVLPPLQIPSHDLKKQVSVGEYREGVVKEVDDEKVGSDKCARVDIGLDEEALLVNNDVNEGERITVRTISRESPIKVQKVMKEVVPYYWGYETSIVNDLGEYLDQLKNRDYRILSTSVKGKHIEKNKKYLRKRNAIIFGSPKKGINEFINTNKLADEEINTLPNQGTLTVRTEEAIQSTLSILNLERS